MVYPMHPRRHQYLVQQSLDPDRQAHVAVLKQRVRLKDQFVDREGQRRNTDQGDLNNPKTGRHRDLPKMKAECRGNIEIGIDVMHVVKTPQKRDFMIGAVPVVEHEIHEHKTDYKLNWRGKIHQIDQTKPTTRDDLQRGRNGWLDECCGGTKGEGGNGKVDEHSGYQRLSRSAQRDKSLQNEENQEQAGQGQTGNEQSRSHGVH